MTNASICLLPDRGVVRVGGDDAAHLLDSLVTNALSKLDSQPAIHTALLNPKGRILFDFFLIPAPGGFLIETAKDQIGELIKQLTFYRLRANVTLEDESDTFDVVAVWNDEAELPDGAISYPDPRHPALGLRVLLPKALTETAVTTNETPDAYHAHRIALGIPEAEADYALGEAFPHEAMYDLLGSADLSKGCFIGQEVVSRMHHLGTPKNRILAVEADAAIPAGAEITDGSVRIGATGSTAGRRALALIRLDRAGEAVDAGRELTAEGIALRLVKPDWVNLDLATGARTDSR